MIILHNQKTGGSHIRSGKPCQDAYAIKKVSTGEVIFAMADGHGDQKYSFSDIGSKLAVAVAQDVLNDMLIKLKEHHEIYAYLKNHLGHHIVKHWKSKVEDSLIEKALDTTEENRKKFGTTLMIGLITKDYTYLGRLGDGDFILINKEKEIVIPMPSDEFIGGETYSLSGTQAFLNFKWAVIRNEDILGLSISTDGLSNGFENDQDFQQFILSVAKCIGVYPLDEIKADLDTKFEECSDIRSGDDLTFIYIDYEGEA